MNFSRIADCIDVDRMQRSKVALIGAGGAVGLACNLVRSGLGFIDAYDFDVVSEENIPRQAHSAVAMGMLKTEALAAEAERINPAVSVRCSNRDVTTMTDDELLAEFRDVNLLINATDSFQAHAFGNQIALRFNIPSLWIGLYPGGVGGEVVFWDRDILPCYRCLCSKRYAAHEQAAAAGHSLDPSSHGCTIFDITHLDAVAGEIAVGLLTRGADNRLGRLIEQLNGRNFVQLQFDPSWTLNGLNPIRERLGVSTDNTAFFTWNTTVLSDPDRGQLYCPDCEKYRGHSFRQDQDQWSRIVPTTGSSSSGKSRRRSPRGHHAA
jgi:molybdopterin/thiamine biosynthesis adenylyltransferase